MRIVGSGRDNMFGPKWHSWLHRKPQLPAEVMYIDETKTMTVPLDMGGNDIDMGGGGVTSSVDPTNPQDVVTKNYADNTFEPTVTPNSAYNKDFGTSAGTVCEGNDTRLMKSDVTLASTTPVYADLTGASWVNGNRGMGIGTGGRIFMMSRYGDALKYVELS